MKSWEHIRHDAWEVWASALASPSSLTLAHVKTIKRKWGRCPRASKKGIIGFCSSFFYDRYTNGSCNALIEDTFLKFRAFYFHSNALVPNYAERFYFNLVNFFLFISK